MEQAPLTPRSLPENGRDGNRKKKLLKMIFILGSVFFKGGFPRKAPAARAADPCERSLRGRSVAPPRRRHHADGCGSSHTGSGGRVSVPALSPFPFRRRLRVRLFRLEEGRVHGMLVGRLRPASRTPPRAAGRKRRAKTLTSVFCGRASMIRAGRLFLPRNENEALPFFRIGPMF